VKKELTDEEKLLDVIESQRSLAVHGLRSEEFDKLVKYLDFSRRPVWEKAVLYGYKIVGVALGLLLILALLGFGGTS
jgi:hypothetical protein